MTTNELLALSPLLALSAGAVLVMMLVAVRRHHGATLALTSLALAASLACLPLAAGVGPTRVTPLLLVDAFALLYIGLIVVATMAVALLAYAYLEHRQEHREEFYILLLVAALGAAVLPASTHFASVFLGLELLSVSLYGLLAYLHTSKLPLEAGIKYLVLAAAASAFLLFGMALVYADMGVMSFNGLAERLPASGHPLALAGLSLVLVGIGFKLAVVPFHLWVPDIYEGAPVPVTAFVATVSKAGVVGLLLRFAASVASPGDGPLYVALALIAGASMVVGTLLALLQRNVKRVLAYSSIAHMGYLLVAFQAGGETGSAAATFYLTAYVLTALLAFGAVTVLSGSERDADRLEDYQGLHRRHPWAAAMLTVSLLSLAGIPLTAGFLGKFFVAASGISSGLWPLVLILAVTSAVGIFYYLRILIAIYGDAPDSPPVPAVPREAWLVLAVLTVAVLVLGVWPTPMWSLVQAAVATL